MAGASLMREAPVYPFVQVRIVAPIRPTEDPDRVLAAVRGLFPDSSPTVDGNFVRGVSNNLNMLLKKSRDERVMDAARGAMWRGRKDEKTTRFELNKQAAFMGRVNFNEVTHPLGDIIVTVEVPSLEALLDKVSPATPAEIDFREGHAARRAAVRREEQALESLGRRIDEGFDESPVGSSEGPDAEVADVDDDATGEQE